MPVRRSARISLIAWLAVFALVAAALRFDLAGRFAYAVEKGRLTADREHLAAIQPGDVADLERTSHAFNVIAEAAKPSVVHITAKSTDRKLNEQIKNMFGQPIPSRPRSGTGSGVIIDEDGHIVTNNHVIAEAEKITVTLSDGRRVTAKTIGTDPKTDIAVIKIQADRLHPARFGDSDKMKVGYLVMAIGSPFRLDHTVSHGIISATERHNVIDDIEYEGFLQTDTPINPGNSGGPLINTRGEIIGINTAIATESGGNMGVGFAIPSNTVKAISDRLKTGQPVVRGYLGVAIRPLDLDVAPFYGLEDTAVMVSGVADGGPALKGGLKEGDVLLSVDGQRVRSSEELQRIIAATDPGRTVDVKILRNKVDQVLKVRIEPQPRNFSTRSSLDDIKVDPKDDPEAGDTGEPIDPSRDEGFKGLGFDVETVSPDLAKRFDLSEAVQNGALVTSIDPLSEAYDAGLRAGCVITKVDGERIRNQGELDKALTDPVLAKGVRVWVKLRDGTGFPMVLKKP